MEYNSQKRINNECFNTWKMLGLTPKRNISYNYKWRSHGAKIKIFMRWEPSHGQHLAGRTLKVCPTHTHTHTCMHSCTRTPHMHTHAHASHTYTDPCTRTAQRHIHAHACTHSYSAKPQDSMDQSIWGTLMSWSGSCQARTHMAKHNRCRFTQLVQETH